jgi:hypothetical protein
MWPWGLLRSWHAATSVASAAAACGGVTAMVAKRWCYRRGGRRYPGDSTSTHVMRSPHLGASSSLPLSILLAVRGVRGGSHGTDVHHGVDAGTLRMMKTPLLACQMLKWFYDTSTGTTTRAACYGSLLERLRSLELTTMEGARWTW